MADAGVRVACIDVDGPGAAATASTLDGAIAVDCDLTDLAAVEAAGVAITECLGRIDGLVDAAGGSRSEARPFLEIDPAVWHTMIDRNLTTTFHTALVFARLMATEHVGSIVLVSSQLSGVARPGLAHYGAAKGAINQLVRGMAIDLSPLGIRVNAIGPGPTQTPGNATWFARPDIQEQHRRQIPLGRVAQPEEMAEAVVHLLSDELSYATGAILLINGGYTLT